VPADSGEVQQIVDQGSHPLSAVLHPLQVLSVFGTEFGGVLFGQDI